MLQFWSWALICLSSQLLCGLRLLVQCVSQENTFVLVYFVPQNFHPVLNKNLSWTFMLNKMLALDLSPWCLNQSANWCSKRNAFKLSGKRLGGDCMQCNCQLPGSQAVMISSIKANVTLTVTHSFIRTQMKNNWTVIWTFVIVCSFL